MRKTAKKKRLKRETPARSMNAKGNAITYAANSNANDLQER